jgi:hypothetical protein
LKAKPRMGLKAFFEEVVEGVVTDVVEGISSVVTWSGTLLRRQLGNWFRM